MKPDRLGGVPGWLCALCSVTMRNAPDRIPRRRECLCVSDKHSRSKWWTEQTTWRVSSRIASCTGRQRRSSRLLNNNALFLHRIMNQGKCCKRAVSGVDPNCAR
eukprot:233145-Chlamydomonas_euryale.AAC.2